jgi:alginate O-acetyltransferase complex protein AlgI
MVFSSPLFLFLFLPAVLGSYFLLRRELRNWVLLAFSLAFYLWGEGTYVAILLVCIGMNYGFGLLLDRFRSPCGSRIVLASSVAANLGFLITFKYANFLVNNLNTLLPAAGIPPIELAPVHLPLGISFFTFQALSYVIDVYRREVTAQRSLVAFALYKTLFPQLIAGPIVRYRDVAAELRERCVTFDDLALGVRRFIMGLGKKMLLANPLSVAADGIFGIPDKGLTASLAWLGVVCYALQIYFDFSGYSEMAIGLGRMFGFRFPENFDYPYAARSVTEFWRRWHMSLSSWFRDYLYIPLGGNRGGQIRLYRNLLLVFLLCGLWHGANWTFAIWGLFHGAFLVIERMGLGTVLENVWSPVRRLYVWLVVLVAWVFFRADTLPRAVAYLGAMAGLGAGNGVEYYPALYLTGQLVLVLVVGALACMPLCPSLAVALDRLAVRLPIGADSIHLGARFARVAAEGAVFTASAAALATGTHNPFIYFRF